MQSVVKEFLQKSPADVIIVGAGLAGTECAWQLLKQGRKVALIEQRPKRTTEAHTSAGFAELVCSNSFKSSAPDSAPALLKHELMRLDSLIMQAAQESQIPAGQALAVDRHRFSDWVSAQLRKHPNLEILEAPVDHFEELLVPPPPPTLGGDLRPVVIATGPLTHHNLAESLKRLIGEQLYFYDAIAPIIAGDSINREIAFEQNRYDKNAEGQSGSAEGGDYLNCPLNEAEYFNFINELKTAPKVDAHSFEKTIYFQGCQPIEAILERGDKSLAFGPMKPVGLTDPRTQQKPFAVLQLRKEDAEGRAWNMVGFQTKLKYPEQQRIFRMIPGLEKAEFYRLGSLHRNTYINSPAVLNENFGLKSHPLIHFAGQITGVEGYLESTAIGALVGRILGLKLSGLGQAPLPPPTTAIGALAHAIIYGKIKNFQPMNINWGLVPLNDIAERDKDKRNKLVQRAHRQFSHWAALFGMSPLK